MNGGADVSSFEWLLFDIGGVLVEFIGAPKILEWMNWRVDREEMSKMWLYSDSVRAYETGKITSFEFADSIVKEFELSIKPDKFIEGFSNFPRGLYHGVEEFLRKLSEKYSVATLSNTNEIHWNRLCKENNFEKLVTNNFLSFRTGYMKPDKEAYLKVVEELNCNADKIIFFDDNRTNVEVGRDIGMNSILVNGFNDLKKQITEMRI
ncbi:MAG: HAD-IA family hydrolase [Ruminiclostridium sp.]|nr:HAD-IA family hydrolase [Ruminiclostridium sp.]